MYGPEDIQVFIKGKLAMVQQLDISMDRAVQRLDSMHGPSEYIAGQTMMTCKLTVMIPLEEGEKPQLSHEDVTVAAWEQELIEDMKGMKELQGEPEPTLEEKLQKATKDKWGVN